MRLLTGDFKIRSKSGPDLNEAAVAFNPCGEAIN